jgi:hypothetical protein
MVFGISYIQFGNCRQLPCTSALRRRSADKKGVKQKVVSLTLRQLHYPIGVDWRVSVALAHKLLRCGGVPIVVIMQVRPSESQLTTPGRGSYLQPICDIRIDLVDDTDAVS